MNAYMIGQHPGQGEHRCTIARCIQSDGMGTTGPKRHIMPSEDRKHRILYPSMPFHRPLLLGTHARRDLTLSNASGTPFSTYNFVLYVPSAAELTRRNSRPWFLNSSCWRNDCV